jgi:predicted  nucleic acid-binding Zn-ribbon protein
MTEPFDTLLALQGRDTAVDQLRHRAASLPERAALADVTARATGLEAALAELTPRIEELAGRQQSIEEQIAGAAGRRHELESRMRTGTGYSTRDLQAMDHEVSSLAGHQRHLEEQELGLLEEQEPLDNEAAEYRGALDGLVAEAARLEAAIAEAETAIAADIETEQAARAQLAVGIPPDLLARYEAVRAKRGGVGAAALVGDRCDGCHLVLPAVDVDRIRHLSPDELAVCPECDRILVR